MSDLDKHLPSPRLQISNVGYAVGISIAIYGGFGYLAYLFFDLFALAHASGPFHAALIVFLGLLFYWVILTFIGYALTSLVFRLDLGDEIVIRRLLQRRSVSWGEVASATFDGDVDIDVILQIPLAISGFEQRLVLQFVDGTKAIAYLTDAQKSVADEIVRKQLKSPAIARYRRPWWRIAGLLLTGVFTLLLGVYVPTTYSSEMWADNFADPILPCLLPFMLLPIGVLLIGLAGYIAMRRRGQPDEGRSVEQGHKKQRQMNP